MTLPLIDADGNPVLCASLDVAGNPDDFSPPVITKDATGALVWAEGVAATAALVGPRTNWRPIPMGMTDSMKSETATSMWLRFGATDKDAVHDDFATTIDGVEYYAFTYDGSPLDTYFDTTQELVDMYNEHVGEVAPYVPITRVPGDTYIYAESIVPGPYVMDFKPLTAGSESTNYQIDQDSLLSYDMSLIQFDSLAFNSTTGHWDMVNPVVSNTASFELYTTPNGLAKAIDCTKMTSFENYYKTHRHILPIDVADERPCVIAGSNMLANGEPVLGGYITIQHHHTLCLPA